MALWKQGEVSKLLDEATGLLCNGKDRTKGSEDSARNFAEKKGRARMPQHSGLCHRKMKLPGFYP